MRKLVLVAALAALGVAMYLLFGHGPRMNVQPSVRAFQAQVPPLPAGVVAFGPASAPPVGESLQAGQVYFGYYCAFCHGAQGRGYGPVGESYVPFPPDLATDKVRSMDDAQLLTAMLTGTGHAPVLQNVVLPQHRPALLRYVRLLAQPPADGN
jgi:mono/diheme cytochrome c family protein